MLQAAAIWACLAGCATTKTPKNALPALSGEHIVLPTTGSGGPFLLRAEVNGLGPYRFVLDTGSTRTVVSRRLVDEAGLTLLPSRAVVLDAEGERVETGGEARLDRIAFGPVTVTHAEALVMNLSRLERTLGERIDGIAPASLFDDFTLVLDYAAGTVWCSRDRLRVGLPLLHERLPVVRADLAGTPEDVLVDSASSGSWMVPFGGLPIIESGYADRTVEQAEQSRRRARAELDGDIRLGQEVFERPIVEQTSGIARVGWHALRGCRVSIDRRSGRLALERLVPIPDEPVWGIGARLERAGNVWEVRAIEPGLPADSAGLRDGERVLAVGGKRADALDAASLAELIRDSQRLRLDVMRAGGIETVWVPVVYMQP